MASRPAGRATRAVVLAVLILAGCATTPATITITPTPDATYTADDEEIGILIRAGADEAIPQLRQLNRMDPSRLEELFVPLGVWIDSQRAAVEALTPSACTAMAVALFLDGMDGYDDIREKFLAWRDWGANGNAFPPGAPNKAIGMIEDALSELEADCGA